MSDRDPSGREVEASNGARIEIQPKAQESNLGNVGCGSAAVQDYEYRIPQGAPCHGVIIQAVAVACLTRQCNQQGCSCPKGWQAVKALEFDHYFELWSFGRGDKRPSNARGLPYIDRFAFAPPEKTCGAYVQFAIAKFFCLTDKISATKQIRDGIKDFRKNGGDARTSCGITSAGLLKSSNGNHNWFNTLPSKAGTSMRTGRVDWSCCGAASDYVFANASPSF